jgi:hypothetical protein
MLRLIVFISLLLSSQIASALSYTLEVSEAEIQERVTAMMPIEKRSHSVTLVVSRPIVELAQNANQMGVYVQLDVTAPNGMKTTGHTKVIGTLSYDVARSEFYFKNPNITEITIDKIPLFYMPTIKSIAQRLLSNMLATKPVYKLKGGDLKHDLAKSMLRSVTVENKQLLVELELF